MEVNRLKLKRAAWVVLHDNPCEDLNDNMWNWLSLLKSEYSSVVSSVFGSDESDVNEELISMFENEFYTDERTGVGRTYQSWARCFATREAVGIYDMLVDSCIANRKLSEQISIIESQNILIDDDDFYGK